MTPDRHAQIRDLFLEAAALPATERGSFLLRRCGGDAELKAEVETLLSHHVEETLAPAGNRASAIGSKRETVASRFARVKSLPAGTESWPC